MTAAEIKSYNRLDTYLESLGIKIIGGGRNRTTNVCAQRPHKEGHRCVNIDVDKQVWYCNDCKIGGSIIDWMATESGKTPGAILRELGGTEDVKPMPVASVEAISKPPPEKSKIEKIYQYRNALGNDAFQVVRLVPKSFRQRHKGKNGDWIWGMEGVERLLYRLPEVMQADTVALCEGEKDAETITSLGWCGTCNVGGAGKWLDGYTESLADKTVLIFPDNDDAGTKHSKLVFDSIAGKAKAVKIIKLPESVKDVTEYVESFGDTSKAKETIQALVNAAYPFIKGVAMPIYTMAEIEQSYQEYAKNAQANSFSLGKWLPSFNMMRNLMPGELVAIVGDTGTGKTGLLQSIAKAALPLPTVLFEIELPRELMFERFVSAVSNIKAADVEQSYANGHPLGEKALNHYFHNLFICDDSRLTIEKMEAIIVRSELKIGVKPKLVLVDYIQLLGAEGEGRYDRASNAAEGLKRLAKATGTIIVFASQRGRPKQDEVAVGLHSAKESGSIENSVGVLIGAWREESDPTLLHLHVLKSTKGGAGLHVECNFFGDSMKINERSKHA